jgi:hypothetical protein
MPFLAEWPYIGLIFSQVWSIGRKLHQPMRMWWGIASLPAAEQLCGEIMKLAQIGMTLLGTNMSNERAFSAMVFVKNCLQSTLTTHLPLSMKVKEEYDLSSFPYSLLP